MIIDLNNAVKTKTLLTKAKENHSGLAHKDELKPCAKQDVSFPTLMNSNVKQSYCD